MTYRSKAAAKRRKRRNRQLRMRNAIVMWLGVPGGAIIGCYIGYLIVRAWMPDHQVFNHPLFN
jgi:hypothetical protein